MKKILLVVDVQNGFITTPELVHIKGNIDTLIRSDYFDYVIATVYENYENSPIIRLIGWNKLLTPYEQELTGAVKTQYDFAVKKRTYSAVNESMLTVLLKIGGGVLPECVYVVGVDTECCVLATATDLFEFGIRPIVLESYCGASNGSVYHNAGLISMRSLIGSCNIYSGIISSERDLDTAYSNAINMLPSSDVGMRLENMVVRLLIEKGWHIAFAESCTGGLAAGRLVNVPDASRVLDVSFVTYANQEKKLYLDVSDTNISTYGVVSEKVAEEMAIGVARRAHAEVGVGISGIAGPGGATADKPGGMV